MTPGRKASRLALVMLAALAAPLSAAPAKRALLVSLPGLSGAEVEGLYRAGALDGGGFAPFFERGEVGPGLRLVDPVLPGPASRVLATGRAPGQTGAVAERWRPPGAPLVARVEIARSPFPATSLWQAVRAAGGRVGSVLWPGLDNSEELRRVDWGISPTTTLHFPSRSLSFTRDRWTDVGYGEGPGPSLYWSMPRTVASYSRPLTVSFPFVLPHEKHELLYDLIAVDRTDDGVVNYDGLVVSWDVNPSKGFVGIVEPGGWLRVELVTASGSKSGAPEVAWIKLIELDPGLERMRAFVTGTYFSRAHPASVVRALAARSLAHPGPPDEDALVEGRAGGRGVDETTFVEQGERLAAYAIDATLTGIAGRPSDLILLELPIFESAARRLSPLDARHPDYDLALAERVRAARLELVRTTDRELGRLLAAIDLDETAIFLVSAYVAQPVHTDVDVGDLLHAAPALAAYRRGADERPWSVEAEEGLAHVYLPIAGRDRDGIFSMSEAKKVARTIRDTLAAQQDRGGPVFEKVLLRRDARRLGLDHPNSGDIIAFARPGYRLVFGSSNPKTVERTPDVAAVGAQLAGAGSPHGLWLALGAGIAPGRARTLPAATDVAPRVAAALGVELPRR